MQLEINYHTTSADYKAYYEDMFRGRKAGQRSNFYYSLAWQLLMLLLGMGVSFLHREIFVGCIFLAAFLLHLKNNWSFEANWNRVADEYANSNPEVSGTLSIDSESITEFSQGVRLTVPWSEIHEYKLDDSRLMLSFLTRRAFILPLRYLENGQLPLLLETIARNKIQKRGEIRPTNLAPPDRSLGL